MLRAETLGQQNEGTCSVVRVDLFPSRVHLVLLSRTLLDPTAFPS